MMTVFGAGTMIGGPLAGWLSDHHGWQWSFWVQVSLAVSLPNKEAISTTKRDNEVGNKEADSQMPIIIFTLIITTLFLPPSPIPPTHPTLLSGLTSLDWPGTILLIGSVTTLILGFSFHTSYLIAWSSPYVWGLLVGSMVMFGLFCFVEKRAGEDAVVDLKNLKSRHRSAIMASGFLLSAANGAFVRFLPICLFLARIIADDRCFTCPYIYIWVRFELMIVRSILLLW
jgi:MFS family permease